MPNKDTAREMAERRVLVASMQDKVALVLAAERLRPDHFKATDHRGVFDALVSLSEGDLAFGPAEIIDKVVDRLKGSQNQCMLNPLEVWEWSLGDGNFVPPGEHERNIDLLIRRYQQDGLINGVRKMLAALELGPAESLDDLDTHLGVLESEYKKDEPTGRSDMVEYTECLATIKSEPEQQRGLLTGFAELDKHIDLLPGKVMTVYGDTGSKKTTLVMNFMARWAQTEKIAVYNYEQTPKEMARMVSDCDPSQRIPTGNLWISPNPPPIESLSAQVRAIKLKRGLDGIVLDYIQTIPSASQRLEENEVSLICFIMKSMLNLARRESIWVVLVAQMRKSQSDSQELSLNPILDRMRGSGEIKNASSIVLSTVLPMKCGLQVVDGINTANLMCVRIKKNRDCLTGNPGEEREIRLIHQLNNRLITSFNEDHYRLERANKAARGSQ